MAKSSQNVAYTELFVGVLFLIIGVTLLTSFAPTIHTATNTAATGALENVTATAKTVYGFSDLAWAGGSIVFIIVGIFSLAMGVKKAVSA